MVKSKGFRVSEDVKVVKVKEEVKEEEKFLDLDDNKIRELIKELDQGEGALIEEVKEKAKVEKVEELLEKMLEKGEIFQNLPGKVKVL